MFLSCQTRVDTTKAEDNSILPYSPWNGDSCSFCEPTFRAPNTMTAPSRHRAWPHGKYDKWKKRCSTCREPDVQSSYITNEAQPNISILRQLTALALPPGAKHDQSPRVHGLSLFHAVCWSIHGQRFGSDKFGRETFSYPMQSIDCTVSAYLIHLISKNGQRLLQPRQGTTHVWHNQIAGYPAAQVIEEHALPPRFSS
jgi:hypothetical protein